MTIEVRTYGTHGPEVVVIHGGPGARGTMAPVARGLADSFRVFEPIQRGSGERPLTVGRHIEDLRKVIEAMPSGCPALVGHSWGAMLALAGPIALIGCGTFDTASRGVFRATCEARMDDDLRKQMQHVEMDVSDPAERVEQMGSLYARLYAYDPLDAEERQGTFDARAHDETWSDMIRLQVEGVYPAAFSAILSPVVMLHCDYDPHPGRMIYANLRDYVPQMEYRELLKCGHEPWRETTVREEFCVALGGWLKSHASSEPATG